MGDNIRAAGCVASGGVVAAAFGNLTIAIDPKTGKELWKGPGGNCVAWSGGGTPSFIIGLACVEAATGKQRWKIDEPKLVTAWYQPLVEGDWLAYYTQIASGSNTGRYSLICHRLAASGPQRKWAIEAPQPMTDSYGTTIARDHIFVDGEKESWAVACEDGQIVGKVAGVGGARTQIAVYADHRVVIEAEGRHGGQFFYLLDAADPKAHRYAAPGKVDDKTGVIPPWVPPSPPTTAYANYPITYPLIDGRLFIRGADGLYCYDLRKPAGRD